MRNFREYDVWKRGIAFTGGIYILTRDLPDHEKFGIISQIRRASVSIPSNIAEGCSRHSEKDFARFVEIALGSAFETETLLIICHEVGYLKQEELNKVVADLQVIQRSLNSLYGKLQGR
ncbi:four helix bundle protein [Salinimicrobium catena]|uniref:four helix bundle protein n=1 Tax=Salinimicrobium catena TaxID=390640 RepID=UPI002FE4322A